MQKMLLFKILAILGLTILICLPMSMIEHTVRERGQFRAEAVASVAAESVREQTVVGPLLVIDYKEEYEELVEVAGDKAGKKEMITRSADRQMLVFPNNLDVKGNIDTNRRYRGIHQVLIFSGQYAMDGDFTVPARSSLPRTNKTARVTVGKTRLSLGIADVRGIQNIPKVDWDGKSFEFEQGAGLASMSSGLHADLAGGPQELATSAKFHFNLGLDGIERQHFAPVGKNNKFALSSNWAHPQFGGLFLPSMKGRSITDAGFSVTWNISSLSTNAQQQLINGEADLANKDATLHKVDRFSVGFIEPVNVYSMSERATKYGLLFVALTFAAFFVFEILKRLPIHPVQYLMVGLALVLFFLLLLSLAERIDFLVAYLIASVACIVLIGFYLSYVLRDWRRGVAFGSALTMLYGALYGLLISESNALVMGSILLFAVLAAIMVATRKVDWYQIGKADFIPA